MIKGRTGSSSDIVHIPYDQAYAEGFEDMMRRIPCTNKLKELVGFAPETGTEDIVDSVIEDKRRDPDDP